MTLQEAGGMREEICRRAFEAFEVDAGAIPPMTLRGGYAEDGYDIAPPYDPTLDEPTDAYLERYTFWGLAYLDAASWRHYVPRLITYAFRYMHDPAMALEGLLHSLRPPDRDPPRLGSLTPEQEAVIVAFLDQIAFSEDSVERDLGMQVLEEWWLPGALYRDRPPPGP